MEAGTRNFDRVDFEFTTTISGTVYTYSVMVIGEMHFFYRTNLFSSPESFSEMKIQNDKLMFRHGEEDMWHKANEDEVDVLIKMKKLYHVYMEEALLG